MEVTFPHHINNLISIKINTGTKYTLTFLEPSLTTSWRALRRLFVRWHRLCWSAVLFVCKMQSTFTRLLAAAHTHIPLAFLNIYFGICLYRHSLVRASWAGCCLSVLISSVLACLLQRIRVLEDRQHTFNEMSKYHKLEQLMQAEERVFSRYLLVQLYGAWRRRRASASPTATWL